MPPSSPRPLQSPGRRRFVAGLGALLLATGLGLRPGPATANFDPSRLRQSMQRLYGQQGLAVLEEWFSLLDLLRGADLQTRLREVNTFFNRRVRWVDDIDNWGAEDHWATPLERSEERRVGKECRAGW